MNEMLNVERLRSTLVYQNGWFMNWPGVKTCRTYASERGFSFEEHHLMSGFSQRKVKTLMINQ
jgi:hypothetical protein